MTLFEILKMIIEALFPKEYAFYFGGTLFFVLILDPWLNKYGNQKKSPNSSPEEEKKFDPPYRDGCEYPM